MKEITLNSIILQLLRNKKVTAILVLIPMILGLAFGLIKSKGGASQVSPVDKAYLESKTLQYRAYDETNKAITEYINNSVYLNIDPKSVFTKTYTIYVAPIVENMDIMSKAGFYYANAVPEKADYDIYKNIIGENIRDKYIDELVPVSYQADTGVLTIKGIYKDPIKASELADANYKRVKALYENFNGQDHTLMDLGSVVTQAEDSNIPTKLGTLLQQVDDQKSRMNALMPFVIQNDENTPAKSSSGVLSSMIKWGILGFAGGIALALLYALLKSPGSNLINDIKEFEKQSGIPVLGFIKQSELTLADRMVVGNSKDLEDQKNIIASKLAIALDGNSEKNSNLLVVGKPIDSISVIKDEGKKNFSDVNFKNVDSINSGNIDQLKAVDSVLFVDSVRSADKEQLKDVSDLVIKAGKNVLGLILTN